jgi:hypothetical protein
MGAKVGGIILLIIALGIALYFVNSGGAAKLGTAFKPPVSATSTASASAATSSSTGAVNPAATTASSTNPFVTFLNELFHPIAPVGPSIPESGSNSGGGEVYTQAGGSGSTGAGTGSTSGGAASIPAYEIPAGYTAAQLSPYFNEVHLGDVGTQEVELYTYQNYNEPTTTIDITGWEIKTNHGGEYVPQAVNIYDPDAAPVLSDIILSSAQNDQIYFYSNSAPQNVRLNSCMGYLSSANYVNQTNQFSPALPDNCPPVSSTAISSFTGACQNYINSLGCNPVNMSSPNIPQNDYACQQYLENNFTYNSCITNHAHDANFLSDTWYIWMGSSPLDQYHDNVVLLDQNGLVVDTYSY